MKKQPILGILCILWMLLIFYFSNQVADDSLGLSDQIVVFLQNLFQSSVDEPSLLWDGLSFLVRKAAHMSEYAILAMLVYGYLSSMRCQQIVGKALLFTIVYACSDEFHQLFVTGRSGQFQDVLIDTVGALIGLLIVCGVRKWRLGIKYRKKSKEVSTVDKDYELR